MSYSREKKLCFVTGCFSCLFEKWSEFWQVLVCAMGVLFKIFSYVSGYIAILLAALAIASGLYLLSELTEEFPTMTGKVLRYLFGTISIVFLLLWMDGLPLYESSIELAALLCYFSMLIKFPFGEFMSIQTTLSVIAFLVTNICWVHYFIVNDFDALSIIGFFVVVVWIIPCSLFVSLSVNDSALPGMIGEPLNNNADHGLDHTTSNGKKKSMFRSLTDYAMGQLDIFGVNVFKVVSNKRK